MGTFFEADLRIPQRQEAAARAWLAAARVEIERLEKIYSSHDPQSDVSNLNRALGTGTEVVLDYSDEMRGLFDRATEVHRASGGRFDPTVGPLVLLWRGASETGKRPDRETLRRARARVGLEKLERPTPNSLRVNPVKMRLDWDGISKGDALDRLRSSFRSQFPESAALLSLGESSLVAIGSPDVDETSGSGREAGWRLALRSGALSESGSEDSRGRPLVLHDRALSVSSSVGRTFEIEGETYSHLIDPTSGEPLLHEAEAIVLADSAAEADAWSTALLLSRDPRPMLRELAARGGVARVRDAQGRVFETESWRAFRQAAD